MPARWENSISEQASGRLEQFHRDMVASRMNEIRASEAVRLQREQAQRQREDQEDEEKAIRMLLQ